MIELLFAAVLLGQDGIACRRDGSTPEINACFAEDLAREEARMVRYLGEAQRRAGETDGLPATSGLQTQTTAWLQASQKAWEAYSEIRCAGVYDNWKQGTIRTSMYLGCKIEATRDRTHDIWTDFLQYMDSTPPILPEPTDPPS